MTSKRIREIYDITPFYYACNDCNTKGSFYGDPFLDTNDSLSIFDDWIDTDELEKIQMLKHSYKAREVLKTIFEDESVAIICKLIGVCPSCGAEMDLDVWIKFQVERKENNMVILSIQDEIILNGDLLRVGAIPGFYRGVDIAAGLQKLYLRWWFLGGDIYVFCPFIDAYNYKYFDQIGNNILLTNSGLLTKDSHRQPFKKIITRRYSSSNNKNTVEDNIRKYINNSEYNMDFSTGRGLAFLLNDSLYGVETLSPEDKSPSNYKTYFHAKMYGATTRFGRAEMVLTSYNYVAYEVMQLESATFMEVESDIFMRQVFKFQDDPHMKIEKIDYSAI